MPSLKFTLAVFIFSLFLYAAIGEIVCEKLSKNICAFSVASSGKRCLLETSIDKKTVYECRTSEIVVEKIANYIETDECVKACGVDRNSMGISSDALLDPNFTNKLCSPVCYDRCHNIVDLYFNLAAGEGAFLPDLCKAAHTNPHRSMVELMSSGNVAAGTPPAGPARSISPTSAPTR